MIRVKERLVRNTLVALLVLNGVTMIASAILVVPNMPVDWIVWGPFADFTIPAVVLGLVGILSLGAAGLVVSIPALGALLAIAAGLATSVYEIVEVLVVGLAILEAPAVPQGWLQPFFFTYGLVVAALAFSLYRAAEASRPLQRAVTGGA